MGPLDDRPAELQEDAGDQAARLAALERQVTALAAEVAALRAERTARSAQPSAPPASHFGSRLNNSLHAQVHTPFSGDQIESYVGRYGTLVLAAVVILTGIGFLIEVAVARGLLTPAVRVGMGAVTAALVAGAGLFFRHRREVRYGDVLLALSLAIVDLVAWGAGPRLHLVPTGAALVVVDLVAIALAWLALHDENEFLFSIAVGGALSAPFVTSERPGGTVPFLAYGALVMLGALRSVRDPRWIRAFDVLLVGAIVYSLAAAAMPTEQGWYAPFVVVLFGGVCATGALLLAQPEWRGTLPRAYLGAALLGVAVAWDRVAEVPLAVTWSVAVALAAVTYWALGVRRAKQPYWTASALVLPFLSLGIAYPSVHGALADASVFALWTLFALGAWQLERRRGEETRAGAHLLAAGLLGILAVCAGLWRMPLPLVAGLAGWGCLLAAVAGRERSPLPLIGVALALGGAALSAFDQLASRQAFAYVPFLTRSSASAAVASLGLLLGGELLGSASEEEGAGAGQGPKRWAGRPLRLGVLVGFLLVWGRMEMAQAFKPDLATFLLIVYYAACGVLLIVAGRSLSIARLRTVGLGLAIYAAVKAMVEAVEIDGVLLRLAVYGAVGVFLLGAGYLYRVRPEEGVVSG
jgi:uncharacterized membrane protein